MIEANSEGYFITGSDTEVGKTYVGCEVVRQLRERGLNIETRKPAESGCEVDAAGNLLTHDAQALRAANGDTESIERIAPYRFRAAVAPHRAARLEDRTIYIEDLLEACERDHPTSCLIVEGAGGFYSPLAENGLNADLATALQLPVIIVVSNRIGAVNQALLTAQAVESRHLRIAAIVLNQTDPEIEAAMDNPADLRACCHHPVFECAYAGTLEPVFGNSGADL
jgi:dethiobiotin synthetase